MRHMSCDQMPQLLHSTLRCRAILLFTPAFLTPVRTQEKSASSLVRPGSSRGLVLKHGHGSVLE